MAAWAAIFRASAQSRSCDGGRAAPEDRPREGRLFSRGEVQSHTGPTRVRSRAPGTDTYRRSHCADDLAAGAQGAEAPEEEGGHAGPPDHLELAHRATHQASEG